MSRATRMTGGCAALALLLAGVAVSAQAQFLQRLTSGVFAFEEAGYGVAVAGSGDRVAVSELLGLSGGAPPVAGGAVEVWRREGAHLLREQRLLSPLPGQGHLFGIGLAMAGERLAVVERGPPGNTGQVHVFERSGTDWQHVAEVLPALPPAGAGVASVALHGDWLLLGLSAGGGAGAPPGQVQAWQRVAGAWTLRQVLVPLDSSDGDGFGLRVALAPGEGAGAPLRLVAGAPFRFGARGAAYVFALAGDAWQQEQRLLLSVPAANDRLGVAVAIRGDTVAAGADGDEFGTAHGGRVGVWRRTGSGDFPWQPAGEFGGAETAAFDRFGGALALATPRDLVIGIPGRDLVPPVGPVLVDAGAAQRRALRVRGGSCATPWSLQIAGLANPGALAQAQARFGFAVAADRLVAIGAPNGNVPGVGRAGFVDVSVQDRLLDHDFDCP
ncbi:MAG: FG-GAP repeat protein [Xanthomonadales bacterium]|nr:FG-GAP repeat protein [Xanthomonadales bacterium]